MMTKNSSKNHPKIVKKEKTNGMQEMNTSLSLGLLQQDALLATFKVWMEKDQTKKTLLSPKP